jgi:hypothetical protein
MKTLTKVLQIVFALAVWIIHILPQQSWAQQTWSLQRETAPIKDGVNTRLTGMSDLSPQSIVYQVGSSGLIQRKDDVSSDWVILNTGTTVTLRDIYMLDQTVGWAVGDGVILKTTNQGVTWSATSFPGVNFQAISSSFNSAIIAVGNGGVIYRSINFGETWTLRDAGTTSNLNDVLVSGFEVTAVGDNGTICRSTDAGSTWTSSTFGTSNLLGVSSSQFGMFAVGVGGTILKLVSGQTWNAMSSGTTQTLRDVIAFSGNTLVVGNNGTILRTVNGTTWSTVSTGILEHLHTIIRSNNRLWAVGEKGTYLSDTQNETCQVPTARTSVSNNNPVNLSACVGSSITFNAYDNGTIGTRVWKKNGGPFNYNASSPHVHPQSITLNNLQSSDAGVYTMEVSSPCGTAITASFTLSVNLPQQPSTVIGPGTASQNVATNYSVSPISGATFTWNAGAGGSVIGSGNAVQLSWSTTGIKFLSVTATDACGTSIARSATVNVISCVAPTQPSLISLTSGSQCSGSSATYSVTNVPGVTYAWSVSAGGTLTNNGNNATVVWNSTIGSRTVSVTPSNGCGSGTTRTLNVNIDSTPVQPAVITGSTTVCTSGSTAYSVANVAGVTYTWNTGGAGTITGNGNAININWTSAGVKTLTVTPSTACGIGTPRTLAVTVNAVPSQPSVIAGSTAVTTGIANQYSVTNEAGITYAWNAGAGGTVTGSGNSVAISWSSAGTKTITLTPSNACGNGTTRTLNVTVSDCAVPVQPSVITGSATACTAAGGTYSVTNVGGVNYTWNAGTDGFVSGSGNSVTLSWTSVGVKTVTVTPSNACGNGTPRTLAVTVNQLPAQPSAITGNITPCRNASLAYSVTNVSGVTYTWDVIGTGTITGSGNSINVTWPATGSHTLRVTPSNACGAGVATTLAVTVNDVPLAASQMTGLTSVCSGNSIPYSVGNLAGVTYTWNGGSGSTVTGSGSAVSISWSTGGTKTVSVTPSNACGNGIASTKTVEVGTTPTQPSTIVGSTAAVGGIAQSYSVTNIPGVTYTWSTNADGVIASTGNSTQVTWATAGVKTLTVTPSNLCGIGTARTLSVTTTVPCTIPGTPSSITLDPGVGTSTNISLNGFRRFVVGPSSGATSLNISVTPSAGTTITPVFGNTWDIVFTIPGTYTVSGFGEISGCGAGAPANITVEVCTGTVATPTAISGQLTDVCRGATTRYSITPVNGVVFDWSLSGFSGVITPVNADRSIVDIAWSAAEIGGDVLTVRAKNACNVQSSSFSETVLFRLKPAYVNLGLAITGSTCAGSGGGLLISMGSPESGTTYTWELNGSGTIAGNNLSVTALADGLSRNINLYGTNACFTNELITGVNYGGGIPVPITPSPVSGPQTIDFNTAGMFSVGAQPAGINFSWDAGTDAIITDGASANIKNIQWTTGGLKTIFVIASNACGISSSRSYNVFVNGPCVAPTVPGIISGESTVCPGVEYQYSVPFQNFDTFNWSAGADATITGSGSIRTIKWSTAGAKTISVTATNLCTTSTARTLAVTVNAIPSQPAILTESTSGCNGAIQQISLASPIAGVTYTWEVQGGNVVTSGAQGQIANITWTSLGVNQVKLKPSNACGNGAPRTLDVTIGTVPDQPSIISGESEVCSATSKTYSVTSVAGVTYVWNAGSGGTVTGSGNSVSISWLTAGSKTITVTPSNACGNGTARTLTVNVGGVPAQPALINGVVSPSLGNEEAYTVSSVAGVNYTWVLSDKGTLAASGNNANVFWNGTGSATLSVTPSNACGNGTARTASITINKINQTVTFTLTSPMLANQTLLLNGEASSGLPVTYTSANTSIAEIFGNELVIKSAGSVNITASQPGDATFAAAIPVVRAVTINKANQAITFEALTATTFGEGSLELSATSDSGLPIAYSSSNTSVATVSGNVLSIVGAGTTNITATQGGNAIFNAATPVVRALVVNKADQSISFGPLSAKGINDPPFTLTATTSSGLALTYSSSNASVATISGSTITIVGEGTTVITATQTGNTNFNAAIPAAQTLVVNGKEGQTITFAAVPAKTFGDANFDLNATASSNLPVNYLSSNTAVATISGTTVTIVGAGSTTITASQSGNEIYNSATSVQQVLTINKANQVISFPALPDQLLSAGSLTLTGSASSGLEVNFVSSNTSVATVSGATLTFLSAGTTTITALQLGNGNFNAAPSVDQTLTITSKQSQSITFAALAEKTFGDVAFELIASSSADLPVQFVSSDVSVATINGNVVSIVGAGTTTITASQPGNDIFQAAPGVARELIVQKANQIITFNLPASANFTSNALSLQATSSAGLVVNFSSSANSIANISGNALTFVTPGTVQVTASQAGNTNYNAASNVVLPLTIIDDRQNISLTGALDFGNVLLGETATKAMTIANTGNAVLQISAITLPQGFSSVVGSTTVNANASITVQITFAPSELKDYEGSVVISSNAVSGSNSLALSGTGVTITGFNEPGQSSDDLDVYPNPGTGVYIIKNKMTRDKSIAITDMSGRVQYRILKSIDEQNHQLDIADLPQGIYYLKIEEKGSVAVKRIVKLN